MRGVRRERPAEVDVPPTERVPNPRSGPRFLRPNGRRPGTINSVIEGPPGIGKTETILNLIANIVAAQHMTVGVVSFGNAAVDNVRDKLDELGFEHVIGNLGRREKREEFFAGQAVRDTQIAQFLARAPDRPDLERLADLSRHLRRLQTAERVRAERREALDAHRLELRHFEDHLHRDELPDLAGLSLLRRSADRVLDYLAESEMELAGIRPGPLRRIRNYFRYGSVRALDPADTSIVLRLQLAYYHKRIAELEREIGRIEDELRRADSNSFPDSTSSCRLSFCIPNSPPGIRNHLRTATALTPTDVGQSSTDSSGTTRRC